MENDCLLVGSRANIPGGLQNQGDPRKDDAVEPQGWRMSNRYCKNVSLC